MTLSPLYLRDLNAEAKLSLEAHLRNERLDLIESLDRGDDIVIGGYYQASNYKKA